MIGVLNPLSWKAFGVLGGVIALCLAILGVQTVRLSAAETRLAAKDTEIAQIRQAAADAALAQVAAHREAERAMAVETERIADETQKQLDAAETRARSARAAVAGLRDAIARLNARAAPQDPAAAAFAHEAAVARELLGACADEHRDVAAAADGLRLQVIGLQDYVTTVVVH
ncbi:MAG TPA: hypothetical protein PLB26_00755 [Rubrivivax sp.]|nr:hypothetical protein [Rubrivivax sp.]